MAKKRAFQPCEINIIRKVLLVLTCSWHVFLYIFKKKRSKYESHNFARLGYIEIVHCGLKRTRSTRNSKVERQVYVTELPVSYTQFKN